MTGRAVRVAATQPAFNQEVNSLPESCQTRVAECAAPAEAAQERILPGRRFRLLLAPLPSE